MLSSRKSLVCQQQPPDGKVSPGDMVTVEPFTVPREKFTLYTLTVELDFVVKRNSAVQIDGQALIDVFRKRYMARPPMTFLMGSIATDRKETHVAPRCSGSPVFKSAFSVTQPRVRRWDWHKSISKWHHGKCYL